MDCVRTPNTLEIDVQALWEKYRQERDKRIRSEGEGQYLETADEFADYGEVLEACTPGYYNNEGKNEKRFHVGEVYAPGPRPFEDILIAWRERGDLVGIELRC